MGQIPGPPGALLWVFSYNGHVLADTTNIENGKWHYAAPPPTGNAPGPEL